METNNLDLITLIQKVPTATVSLQLSDLNTFSRRLIAQTREEYEREITGRLEARNEVYLKTFSGEIKENGMFQRILFVPNSSEDKPLIWSDYDDLPSTRDTDWKRFITRALDYAAEYREYKLDKYAWTYLCRWQNSKEEELNADGDKSRVEIFRKSQIYAIRLCILFKVIHEIAGGKNPTDIVENIDAFRATELTNYFYQASCCTYDFVTSGGYDDGASRFLLLYEQLPGVFTTQMALSLADAMSIPRSTLFYKIFYLSRQKSKRKIANV